MRHVLRHLIIQAEELRDGEVLPRRVWEGHGPLWAEQRVDIRKRGGADQDDVIARATIKMIASTTTHQGIIAVAAEQHVIAIPAREGIVTGVATERVWATES